MLPFLLYCLAVGAVAVPKINIILALMCVRDQPNRRSRSINSDDICSRPAIHAEMGRFVTYANLTSGILCVFSSPRLGALSDRYGRKPLIAFSAVGMLMGDVISVTAATFPQRISVYWILLEFVIGGLTGAFVATVAFVQAYATDSSPLEERSKVFSQLHACMYVGMGLGPAVGAFLVRTLGQGNMLWVFYAAGLFHLLFICYVLLALPESLPAVQNAKTAKDPANATSVLCHGNPTYTARLRRILGSCNILVPLGVFGPSSATNVSGRSRSSLPTLAAIDALVFGVQVGLPQLLILFSEYQLQWRNLETNLFFSITNIVRAIALVVLLPQALKMAATWSSRGTATSDDLLLRDDDASKARRVDIMAIRGTLFLDILGNLGFAISRTPTLFILSGIVAATGSPASPVILSCMTTYIGPERVGELFGAIGLLHALARVLIPPVMQIGYSVTLISTPHALFWGISALFGVAFMATLRVK